MSHLILGSYRVNDIVSDIVRSVINTNDELYIRKIYCVRCDF